MWRCVQLGAVFLCRSAAFREGQKQKKQKKQKTLSNIKGCSHWSHQAQFKAAQLGEEKLIWIIWNPKGLLDSRIS